MNKNIAIIKACRNKWLSILADLSTDQLNQIPTGFNNNLAWQLGHVIVSQQILCYRLAGKDFVINNDLIDRYKNGSRPEQYIDEQEIDLLKGYLISTIDQLEKGLDSGLFDQFNAYTISTFPGLTLENIHDAVAFVVAHDALHYGCSTSLKRLILQSN